MPLFRLSAFADEAAADFAGQIAALKRHGIDLMEIRGVNGKNLSKLTDDEARKARAMLDDAGVGLSALGSPYGKYPIEADFAVHREEFRRGLALAHMLGTEKIRMFSFFIPAGNDPAAWRGKVRDQLGEMLDLAAAEGVLLCHENEKGIYGDTDDRCVELLDMFPQLGCVFDPANFIQCGVDVLPAFRRLSEHVTYMHIKDALASSGAVVPAGCGDACFPALMGALNDLGRPMVLTLEPHLTVFKGLEELQDEALRHQYAYPDALAAFDAAVAALRGLLAAHTPE